MFAQLLERLGTALNGAGFRYMVIGGQAILLYGEPRLTKDIDITVDADLDRLSNLVAMARAMGLRSLVDPEEFTTRTMVLPCEDPSSGIRVDFILSFSPYERQALARARNVTIGGAPIRFASPEDVVVHKIIAGRPRDIEDVRSLLVKNPGVDTAYIERWLREFDAALGESHVAAFRAVLGDSGAGPKR